jgi:hypothetical protein
MSSRRNVLFTAVLLALGALAVWLLLASRAPEGGAVDDSVVPVAEHAAGLAPVPSRAPADGRVAGPDAAAVAGRRRVVARRLDGATPIARLAFKTKAADGAPLVTDASGEFEWDLTEELPEPVEDSWARAGRRAQADGRFALPVAWFGRSLAIRGRVVPAPGDGEIAAAEMRSMKVRLDVAVPSGRGLEAAVRDESNSGAAESNVWSRSTRSRFETKPSRFDPVTGEFEFATVVVHNVGVRAIGPGWSCRAIRIDDRVGVSEGSAFVRVEVVVHRRPKLTGRVLDENGAPTKKARVSLNLRSQESSAVADPEWYAGFGFGVQFGATKDGMSYISLLAATDTDSDGNFSIEAPGDIDWPATVVVLARPEAAPIRASLVSVRGVKPMEVRWRPSSARVRLFRDGRPLADTEVRLNDLTDRRWQITLSNGLRTDAEGWMSAAWFEPGHDYGVSPYPPLADRPSSRLVRWRNQPTLDLDALYWNLSDFDADPNR